MTSYLKKNFKSFKIDKKVTVIWILVTCCAGGTYYFTKNTRSSGFLALIILRICCLFKIPKSTDRTQIENKQHDDHNI